MIGRALLPRVVRLGERTWRVPPPSTGQAIALLEALAEGDEALLHELLEDILPADLMASLLQRPGAVARLLRPLLFQGVEMPESGEGGRIDWDLLVAQYCETWGCEPWYVLREVPFPVFLTMLRQLPAVRARRILDAIQAAGAPHLKPEAFRRLVQRLERQAAGPDREETKQVDYRAEREALKRTLGVR